MMISCWLSNYWRHTLEIPSLLHFLLLLPFIRDDKAHVFHHLDQDEDPVISPSSPRITSIVHVTSHDINITLFAGSNHDELPDSSSLHVWSYRTGAPETSGSSLCSTIGWWSRSGEEAAAALFALWRRVCLFEAVQTELYALLPADCLTGRKIQDAGFPSGKKQLLHKGQ